MMHGFGLWMLRLPAAAVLFLAACGLLAVG